MTHIKSVAVCYLRFDVIQVTEAACTPSQVRNAMIFNALSQLSKYMEEAIQSLPNSSQEVGKLILQRSDSAKVFKKPQASILGLSEQILEPLFTQFYPVVERSLMALHDEDFSRWWLFGTSYYWAHVDPPLHTHNQNHSTWNCYSIKFWTFSKNILPVCDVRYSVVKVCYFISFHFLHWFTGTKAKPGWTYCRILPSTSLPCATLERCNRCCLVLVFSLMFRPGNLKLQLMLFSLNLLSPPLFRSK